MREIRPLEDSQEQPARWRALTLVSIALVFGMSTWFSASAVIPQLEDVWGLTATTKAWITIAVQIGFVAGAITSAVLNLADRFPNRLAILGGAAGAATANVFLVGAGGPAVGIPLRFATGFFIAAVYPPAFRLIATWFKRSRGLALGTAGGAIVVGNALPHLVNGLGGVGWESVIWATSALSLTGGLAAATVREGPFPFPTARFDAAQIGKVFRNRGVRLASIGYFGHMWELFAMYAWFLVFLSDQIADRGGAALPAAAYATFAVMAIGGLGSLVAGLVADRWGRTNTTTLMLAISGSCSLLIGLLFDGPTWIVIAVGLVWGFAIVADSAQFSAIVTEVGDQSYVGTALTMQIAIGFTVTVATIWIVPLIEDAVSWRWAFALLALGPIASIAAMQRLKRLPEAAQIAGGRG
jgi:MFS family permease